MSLNSPLCCALVLALAACQQSAPAPAVAEVAPGAVAASPVAAGPQTQPSAHAPAVLASDQTPKLTRNADGTLRLEFTDRWGKPFDATYESLEFLRRAVPVVRRAMTDEQVAHLENQLAPTP